MADGFLDVVVRHIDLGRLVNSLIVGVVSSAATWTIIAVSQRLSDRRKFSGYSGIYETYTIDDERIEGERTRVQWLGRNMLYAYNESDDGLWESHITMNNDLPHVGAGYFRYKDVNNWGSHEIQSNPDKTEILVFSTGAKRRIPDPDESSRLRPTVAYKWRRAVP
jgi:hypothetical protein